MSLETYSFVIRTGGFAKRFYVGLLSELPIGNVGDLFFAIDNGHFYSSDGISLNKILDSSDTPIPAAHAASHQNGGSDEISISGLSGLLADSQTALAHASSHTSIGSDSLTLSESQITNLVSDLASKAVLPITESDVTNLTTDLASKVTSSRTITAGLGLIGGGDLSSDKTLTIGAGTGITVNTDDIAVNYGSTSTTACIGNDSRLSDSRSPTSHASSHIAAGSDPLTLSESQVTNLTTDLAAKVLTATQVIAGAGLTGGGTLAADRTLVVGAGTGITVNADDIAVNYGTSSSTACIGNDSRLSDSRIPLSHASTHIPGGTDAIATGTTSVTLCIGNDSRLSNSRTPTAHATSHNAGGSDVLVIDAVAGTGSLRTLGVTGTSACAGNDSRLNDNRTPIAHVTNHYPDGSDPNLQFPVYSTTLLVSQTVLTGYNAWLNGPITIPSGITLTIQGTGQVQIGSSSIINIA